MLSEKAELLEEGPYPYSLGEKLCQDQRAPTRLGGGTAPLGAFLRLGAPEAGLPEIPPFPDGENETQRETGKWNMKPLKGSGEESVQTPSQLLSLEKPQKCLPSEPASDKTCRETKGAGLLRTSQTLISVLLIFGVAAYAEERDELQKLGARGRGCSQD